jgi:hypothetical protein
MRGREKPEPSSGAARTALSVPQSPMNTAFVWPETAGANVEALGATWGELGNAIDAVERAP